MVIPSSSSSCVSATLVFCLLSHLLAMSHGDGKSDGGDVEAASDSVYNIRRLPTLDSLAMPVSQPYRTAYHFQPSKNWMNDPNGPMVYKGIYHLFYQWNPKGAVWGNIIWGHSTSTDLVNWTPHEPAIVPSSQSADINGCWSGSANIRPDGAPAILYTGINSVHEQVQNIALPKNVSDPYLKEWVKSPLNPLMEATALNKIEPTWFRDPTTAWLGLDGKWRILIGSKRGKMGMAILYRSEDFLHWTQVEHPFHSTEDTGMWECPDFFPVSTSTPDGLDTSVDGSHVRHVLKISFYDRARDLYLIGTYDRINDVFVPDGGSVGGGSWRWCDHGKFYASKSFFDNTTSRRILWGWVNESSSAEDDIRKGWSGLQGVPRKIWLDKSGKQLLQWPIEEIETLRVGQVDLSNQMIKAGTKFEVSGITASQADVEISFEVPELDKAEVLDPSWTDPDSLCSQKGASVSGGIGPFGLMVLASRELEEYTGVFFRIFKDHDSKYVVLMCSDQSRSSVNESNDKASFGAFVDIDPVQEKLSLRILIDHSIVESFGGQGKACITARVYPTMAIEDGAHIFAFNYGSADIRISRLSAWSMKKAQIN